MKLTEINGKDFYYAFLAGSSRIMKHQRLMNKINVFPVPDGDTGSNLASTVRHIIEQTRPDRSFKKTVDSIAAAAIDGARGNSGIIFAQFLYGISQKIDKEQKINIKRFSQAIKSALHYAISAIEKPVEGTIITVLRDWVNHIDKIKEKFDDFFQLIKESLKTAKKSLKETPRQLDILKKYNVVDAGAQGFVFFLEGIIDLLKEGNLKKILRFKTTKIEPINETHSFEDIKYRYCTEAILEGENLDKQSVKVILGELGDSVVIAGSQQKMRIHIHTNAPAELFYQLKDLGELPFQKVDDMKRQYEAAHQRKWNIALVTDSVCDLPREVMDHYQIHMASINIHFGKSNYLDKKSITPDQFYTMLKEDKEFPTTSQPGLQDFLNLYNHLSSYYDSIIAVHMSKHLSGTWNVSHNAAQQVEKETGKKISVINSHQLSGTLGLMVLRTAEAIANGLTHDEIIEQLEKWANQSTILVSVKTLKYMVKGGRVSPMKGWLANVLNLKPIVSVDADGKSVLYDKAFSQKGNMKKVMKITQGKMRNNTLWKYSILHAHDPEEAAWFAVKLTQLLGKKPDFIIDISPAVGLSAGHGAVAVSLMLD
ncbi:MAG: DegV family protein [Candidatus Aminicenantes bacterium]|jgi:DegV family protein with EDD domain